MFASNPLFPLCCYCTALLVLVLAGSWAIAYARQNFAPTPALEVTL